jgi:hypothetical protein
MLFTWERFVMGLFGLAAGRDQPGRGGSVLA